MFVSRILSARTRWSVAFAALVVISPGCGDDSGLSARYPVTGKVTYKGVPVKKAAINFQPNDPDGRPAGGKVENGEFVLTTLSPSDGAIPGKYKVTVDDRELDADAIQSQADAEGKKKGVSYAVIPQHLQANALKKMKSVLPGKYQIASTSDIEVEVKAETNTLTFDLKD
ncbi:hypothetical protein SAMN05444166_5340 [Singulisphaera sp. GP187]|uniref:hypothetical protein n=1 Tax=Singulisphaera sp. GP187 TaxID=1882752 RepID=UPI000926B3BE|nr:hypothetical protein [Singulisphaera sp. GP187]SIO57072.1 hypothetical protein SAMN05444166_5340 [Singulisphaera sp. GP187]